MATITAPMKLNGCGQSKQVSLERVNYFPRQLLTADDMIADQNYFRERMRRHNRYLHGWGVVCGLEVTAAPTEATPWRVKVGAGYALGPYGDEIDVAEAQTLDLAGCLSATAADPCEPSAPLDAAGQRVYVVVKYSECFASPVLAMPAGCGCEESACEYSRIRDGFEICCLTELPPSAKPPLICDLITHAKLPPCPPRPDDPWVVLAQVDLPASSGTEVINSMINNIIVRRQIYSTAMLQEQLIRCCCGERTQPTPVPVHVTKVSPANDSTFTNSAPEVITLTFNKDVQADTVNKQTIIVRKSDQPIDGQVDYDAAARVAIFKPAESLRPDKYTVIARGAGNPHITDADDLALDGNKDGVGGDNFSSKFTVDEVPR
jgi:hypothetical protein